MKRIAVALALLASLCGVARAQTDPGQPPAASIYGAPANQLLPDYFRLQDLTAKGSPDSTLDFLLLWDNVSGTFKKVTPGSIATAAVAGVSSFNARTGDITLYEAPQGRLTLTSGVPVNISDVAGASTLYYTPAVGGGYVPTTLDGSTFQMTQFAEVSQLTTDATKSPAATVANANYDIFCWINAGTNRCTRGDYWKFPSLPVTITIASPAVVTMTGSAFNTNFNPPIVFSTTGALPTGIVAGTTYYILGGSVVGSTFQISATPGGAAINTSGTQSGTQAAVVGDDFGLSYRLGTNSLTRVAGLLFNTNSITNGPAALRGTYVGTVRTDASALLNMTFGSTTAGGGQSLLYVWNAYNQVPVHVVVGDNTVGGWPYAALVARMMNNSSGNRIRFVKGLATEPITVLRGGAMQVAAAAGAFAFIGFALDATAVFDRTTQATTQAAVTVLYFQAAQGGYKPMLGAHFIQAVEEGDGSHTTQFYGTAQKEYFEADTWQ